MTVRTVLSTVARPSWAMLLPAAMGLACAAPREASLQPRRPSAGTPEVEVPVTADVRSALEICRAAVASDAEPVPPSPDVECVVRRSRGCVAIVPDNRMGSLMRLVELEVRLDGVRAVHADEHGDAVSRSPLPSRVVPIASGTHELRSVWAFRGNPYGIFSMSTYRLLVRAHHRFAIAEGQSLQLGIVAIDVGSITAPIEQRPRIVHVETAVGLPAGG